MSERGSFVTQYVNCEECFKAVWEVLGHFDDKFMCSVQVPGYDLGLDAEGRGRGLSVPLPIVAGKIGGMYSGEELYDFEHHYAPELAKLICHPVRVAVLPDSAAGAILTVQPEGQEVEA